MEQTETSSGIVASGCTAAPETAPNPDRDRVTIEFLYLDLTECDRCKGTHQQLEAALPLIRQVLEASGYAVELRKTHVQNEPQAAALGFVVSPTIRVNNRDTQLRWRETFCAPCSDGCTTQVSCREWEFAGRWYAVPPKALIIRRILQEALRDVPESAGPIPDAKIPENLKRFFGKQTCCGARK